MTRQLVRINCAVVIAHGMSIFRHTLRSFDYWFVCPVVQWRACVVRKAQVCRYSPRQEPPFPQGASKHTKPGRAQLDCNCNYNAIPQDAKRTHTHLQITEQRKANVHIWLDRKIQLFGDYHWREVMDDVDWCWAFFKCMAALTGGSSGESYAKDLGDCNR